jgi:beta-phosphoglucomutase
VTVAAIAFDFNGTLSDDEPVLYAAYAELFAELGKPLSESVYRERLAGLSEHAIFRAWLGERDDLEQLVARRIDGYNRRVADGSTVHEHTRAAVRAAATRVPVAVVSGAAHAEVEPVLEAAGLLGLFTAIVCDDDVTAGKPDPQSYTQAVQLLGVDPEAAMAIEDTQAGVTSARAAGLRCIAVLGTHPPQRLAAAERLVAAVTPELIDSVLSGSG